LHEACYAATLVLMVVIQCVLVHESLCNIRWHVMKLKKIVIHPVPIFFAS